MCKCYKRCISFYLLSIYFLSTFCLLPSISHLLLSTTFPPQLFPPYPVPATKVTKSSLQTTVALQLAPQTKVCHILPPSRRLSCQFVTVAEKLLNTILHLLERYLYWGGVTVRLPVSGITWGLEQRSIALPLSWCVLLVRWNFRLMGFIASMKL